jgi:hypothetical protein
MKGRHIVGYKLIGRLPVPVEDLFEWASWFETSDVKRIVAKTEVGPLLVSTIFMAIDYNFSGRGDPILFETMVFGGQAPQIIDGRDLGDWSENYCDRYSTWDEAEKGHAVAVEWAREKVRQATEMLALPASPEES